MKKSTAIYQVILGVIISFILITYSAIFFFNKLNKNSIFSQEVVQLSQEKLAILNHLKDNVNHISDDKLHYIFDKNSEDLVENDNVIKDSNEIIAVLKKEDVYFQTNAATIQQLHEKLNEYTNSVAFMKEVRVNSENAYIAHLAQKREIEIGINEVNADIIAKRTAYLKEFSQTIEAAKTKTYILITIGLGILIFIFVRIMNVFKILQKAIYNSKKNNTELKEMSAEIEKNNWVLGNLSQFDNSIRGDLKEKELAEIALRSIVKITQSLAASIYMYEEDAAAFKLKSSVGISEESQLKTFISSDNGLIAEFIKSKEIKIIQKIKSSDLIVQTTLTEQLSTDIYLIPLIFEENCVGFIELITPAEQAFEEHILEFFQKLGSNLAITFAVTQAHSKLAELLEELQQQTEELEAQQEELRTTNEELMHKTNLLEASEEELRVQQEELYQSNIELEEKANLLAVQNDDLQKARQAIADKIHEVELASKYKSEFMANMSHELRTPLNSILILAKLLQDNKQENLHSEQVKFASVIHSAGSDLLHLINELLDLAKIESGNVDVAKDHIVIAELAEEINELFKSTAADKNINFSINTAADIPKQIISDEYRLSQVLKNLLANAFKFTEKNGHVALNILRKDQHIQFQVKDNGIGIAKEKQALIFEAFQQEDGSTSRKYGGTGLGLSICREIAQLLSGKISIESEQHQGSTFTFTIPITYVEKIDHAQVEILKDSYQPAAVSIKENTPLLQKSDSIQPVLLIIEDDYNFAEILKEYATDNGFKTALSHTGNEGLEKAKEIIPDAIILDVMLPNMDGWTVLKELKANASTKDIPVHMMSAATYSKTDSIKEGAIGFLSKPVSEDALIKAFNKIRENIKTPLKRVLLIEDHELQSDFIKNSLNGQNTIVDQAFDAKSALEILSNGNSYDCIILDINLPDRSGMDLLDEIKTIQQYKDTPIVINTAMELTAENTNQILQHSQAMVLKSGKSNHRLIDEVNLFLNRIKLEDSKPSPTLNAPTEIMLEKVLAGKRILLADDDMRNVFALSSAFEAYDMHIEIANNGLEALSLLADNEHIDLVLMDIMMPEMDGFEAITKIREQQKFAKLPIIAVTAKAMKGDKEKAIEIGANDYISKPIDINKLISLMRVWLS